MSNGITPLTPAQLAAEEVTAAHEGYFHRDGVAVDQALNVVTDGLPGETLSSRWARAAERGNKAAIVATKVLGWIQRNHGAKAQASDLERAKIVEATEESSPGWK